jgi:hypothetical protein
MPPLKTNSFQTIKVIPYRKVSDTSQGSRVHSGVKHA